MFGEKTGKIINVVLIIIAVLVSLLSTTLILFLHLNKAEVNRYAKVTDGLEANYAPEEETNSWDISVNQDGSVIATLSEDGTLIISGTGKMMTYAVYSAEYQGLKIEEIKSIIIEDGVTNIGDYAFVGCNNLKSIEIPNSVTSIGCSAFYGCSGITTIKIPNGVTNIGDSTFMFCENLTTIEIPNSVTSIGNSTFMYCENLTSIEIPNSVISIGEGAFSNCDNLTTIEISNSVTSIGDNAFSGCENLTAIEVDTDNEYYMDDNGVLYTKDGTQLIQYPVGKKETEYKILSGTTSIGDCAFEWCGNLKSIEIPEGVTSIGSWAFGFCINLTTIEIPNSVTSIGSWAFGSCINLTTIEIPNSVTSIGNSAFRACDGLTSIKVDADNEYYMDDNGVLYTKDGTQLIQYAIGKKETEYIILSGTTSIGYYAFEHCENLTSIEIPNSVISIEDNAFSGCNNLTSIEIQNSVTSIGNHAFAFCDNLTSIEIPNSVTSIGTGAFEYCEKLTTIEIPNSVTSIGDFAFYGCFGLTSIKVAPDNEYYMDDNGVLYTKDGTQLIQYPSQKEEENYTILTGTITIEGYAFENCEKLVNIQIPNSVTSIGDYAFSGCNNLTSIEIPNSVTSIGYDALNGCDGLTSIEVESDNEYYMDDNGVLYTKDGTQLIKYPSQKEEENYTILIGTTDIESYAFENSKKLVNIQISNSVIYIGDSAFNGCDRLTSIEVDSDNEYYMDNNGVLYTKDGTRLIKYPSQKEEANYTILTGTTTIEDRAFENCEKLVNIQIPESVEEIGMDFLKGSYNLESIEVDVDNEYYMDDNGVLYTKDGTILIKYPEGKKETKYIILDSTESIEMDAFINCKNLVEIQIPGSVLTIYDGAFDGCENLTIICERGSAAEEYAKRNNIKYRIIGEENILTSTVQKVDEENKTIKGINPKMTVEEIRQNLQGEQSYEIVDLQGNTVTDTDKIGTGYKIKMEDGKEYTLIVWGDLNGDGEIKISDLARISMIGVGDAEPSELEKLAIDVNSDEDIKVNDLAIISRFAVQ